MERQITNLNEKIDDVIWNPFVKKKKKKSMLTTKRKTSLYWTKQKLSRLKKIQHKNEPIGTTPTVSAVKYNVNYSTV